MKIHPRQYAIENNQSTYNGKPCKKCDGTLRYTSMTGCVACTRENSFIRNKTGIQKEYIEKNRKKINAYNRKTYNSLSEEEKTIRNRRQQVALYGLTLEQYDAMVIEQNGVCAICKQSETVSIKKNMCIDHDHKTGKVRQLLCDKCNRGIGYFNESIDALEQAVLYLKKHS
jgi:sulfur transfer complex TusBCD TusB component (DsrH family)